MKWYDLNKLLKIKVFTIVHKSDLRRWKFIIYMKRVNFLRSCQSGYILVFHSFSEPTGESLYDLA